MQKLKNFLTFCSVLVFTFSTSDYKLSQDTLGFPFPRDDTEIQTAWSAAERRSHSPTPLLPQTRQPWEARSFHSSHTHVTLALAQRASSSEHGAGRQAAPGERGQGALGQEAEGSWPKCRGREQGNGSCWPQSWGWSLREEAAAGAVGGGSGSGPRVSTESLCGQEANVLITGKKGSEVSKGDGRMAKFLAGEEMPAKVKQK